MISNKKVRGVAIVIAFSILLNSMTACNKEKVEIRTDIAVPEKTTMVTLDKAEPTKTCRAEKYDMDLKLDVKNKQLFGQVTMRLTNETEDILNELCIRTDAASDMDITNPRIVENNVHPEIK